MKKVVVISTTYPEDDYYNNDLTCVIRELGFEPTVISFLDAAAEIKQINISHAVIIGGVPFHYPAESAEQLVPYLTPWLFEVEIPVLGICLGHQAIGLAFGATMKRHEETEEGLCIAQTLEEHSDDPVFNALTESFEVASFHWASISIEDSDRLKCIASSFPLAGVSTGCKNLVVRVDGKKIYGAQFHPEKSKTGKLFLQNFLQLQVEAK